jgi:serine protease Do
MMRELLTRLLAALAPFFLFAAQAQAQASGPWPDFTTLVEREGAAVVNISTRQPASETAGELLNLFPLPDLDESDPMFEFFRRLIPRLPRGLRPDPDPRSLGSGFIIGADGYILTNAHLVADAEEILVRLADRRAFNATVVGADERTDVALLRIAAEGLPQVTLGDPSQLKVGDWVLAIGSPFGFEHSATAGIVSAKGRSLPQESLVPFIQTDVAINPGNSGGPLFNLKGEVVGINSQIYSRTGGFMGLSFAIPIDVAMEVQQQLRLKGRVERGRIGVAIQAVTPELAESFGLPRASGALVSAVEPDSPAAKAGIEQGDVILRFNGQPVEDASELPRLVAAARPASRVQLEIHRRGRTRLMTLEVGEWQDTAKAARSATPKPAVANRLGVVLVEPSSAQRRERDLAHGLIVERVDGAVTRSELRRGDVVLAIVAGGRQTRLETLADFERAVAALRPGQQVTLLVQREGTSSYLSLRAGD